MVNVHKPAGSVPAHVPSELVRDFDYHSDSRYLAEPFEALDRLRDMRVLWSSSRGGYWVLTRAKDIEEAFKRPDLFSSETRARVQDLSPSRTVGSDHRMIPTGVDPPDHGKYRRLLVPLFTPVAVQKMRDGIAQVCSDLIDRIIDNGKCEFIKDFAWPFPGTVFTRIMGLPPEDLDEFVVWEYDLLHSGNHERILAAKANVTRYLTDLIEKRKAHPESDLISHIALGSVDGRPMTADETLDTCTLFFLAGLDTVAAALGIIFKYLAEHPEDRRSLAENPAAIPGALEELMRLHAGVNPSRTVAQDVEFAGVLMKEGDQLLLSTALASRDPEKFADPTRALLTRQPNAHTVFGSGPHVCLGAHLARLELNVAVTDWLARIPDFWIADKDGANYHGGGVIGLDSLQLAWR